MQMKNPCAREMVLPFRKGIASLILGDDACLRSAGDRKPVSRFLFALGHFARPSRNEQAQLFLL